MASSPASTIGSVSPIGTKSSRVLKLKASDDVILELEESVCMQMGTIKRMISESKNNDVQMIPLSDVGSKILAKVVEWCKFHATVNEGDKKEDEEEKKKKKKRVRLWEDEFVRLDNVDELLHMVKAARYLNVEPLLDRLCKQVANLMKGKTAEEIRRVFNIKNDLDDHE